DHLSPYSGIPPRDDSRFHEACGVGSLGEVVPIPDYQALYFSRFKNPVCCCVNYRLLTADNEFDHRLPHSYPAA
ncbi:MAG TPA: hypothetical protein VIV66_23300, partial [Pyrinomonadaceae bacterium]